MNKKCFWIYVCVIGLTQNARSQQTSTLEKTAVEIPSTPHTLANSSFIGETPGGSFVSYRSVPSAKITLVVMSKDGKTQQEREFTTVKVGKEKQFPLTFFALNNEIYVMYFSRNKKESKQVYVAYRINQQNLVPEVEAKKLFEYAYSGYIDQVATTNGMQVLVVPGGQRVVMYSAAKVTTTSSSMHMRCFNHELELIHFAEHATPMEPMDVRQQLVGNDGSLYVLYQGIPANANAHTLPPFKILKLGVDGKSEIKPIELFGEHLMDMRMLLAKNGNITMAGYYSENAHNSIRGVFSALLDNTTLALSNITT
ncbi:MAG: hypothetical protein ACHQF2_03560, partial [Flavobacteriales bacterium]